MSKTSKPKQAFDAVSKEGLQGSSEEPELYELLVDGLTDIYWAENQLIKALPLMEAAATNAKLTNAIAAHLEVTIAHITKLEDIFALLSEKPLAKKCDAMEGLTKEAEAIIEDTESGSVARDTGIIMACRKAEHHKIAAYTNLQNLAEKLKQKRLATLLAKNLAEEQDADQHLSVISESLLNDL